MDLDSVLLQQLLELWLVPLFLLQDVVEGIGLLCAFLSHYRQQLVPFYQCFFTGTSGFYSLIWLSALLLFIALVGIFFIHVEKNY